MMGASGWRGTETYHFFGLDFAVGNADEVVHQVVLLEVCVGAGTEVLDDSGLSGHASYP